MADDEADDGSIDDPHPGDLSAEVRALRGRIDEIEDRIVHRDVVEAELERYVRGRTRRGHASGWGPYLVLLYGTAMTVGAFYFLSGGWAILAMLVIWTSTLGVYTVMIIVGIGLNASAVPRRLIDAVRDRRS